MFKFETLDIWKESVKFADEIYQVVRNSSDYSLNDQIKRAANSIALNIAEGTGRGSKNDFKRFIQISIGSLYEVVTCLYIMKNHKDITQEAFTRLYERSQQLSKMLHGFMSYLEKEQ
ncbi:MAG: four helix bundle protein [Candidatus Omnitrophica bacterium]|nr:four helix bundle protein [Candidatus Omnitrophota bacterium]